MKLAFFGTHNSLAYDQIGGTEAFARRVASAALEAGADVDYLLIDGQGEGVEEIVPGRWSIYNHTSYEGAERALLSNHYDLILSAYIPRTERLRFSLTRRRLSPKAWPIVFLLPRARYLRIGYGLDLILGGRRAVTIAPSLARFARRFGIDARTILPPVPTSYFRRKTPRGPDRKIRVGFLGRADLGKGTDVAFRVLDALSQDPRFEAAASVYPWESDIDAARLMEKWRGSARFSLHETTYQSWRPAVDDTVVDFLEWADVLLFPYRPQTRTIESPLALLEAMAAGCIPISTPVGDMPWLIRDRRFLLPEDNWTPESIAAHISALDFEECRALVRQRIDDIGCEAPRVFAQLRNLTEAPQS